MTTQQSLRAAARAEQAVKKHQLARERSEERGPGEGGGKKGPSWTFSRLEYLSRYGCTGVRVHVCTEQSSQRAH